MESLELSLDRSGQRRLMRYPPLKLAVVLWFVTFTTGQWIFVSYIIVFYGGSALQGNLDGWEAVLAYGYIEGATLTNIALIGHLLFSGVIHFAGPLQPISKIRSKYPKLHRITGRVYILTAFIMSITGLFMILKGHAPGDISQQIGISLNGIVIMIYAALAWRFGLARNITIHRRYALRLLMAASGVWFFRVGLMLSFLLYGGPFGFDPQTFEGPFLTFLSYAQFLLPIVILEIYFWTRDSRGVRAQGILAVALLFVTVAMGAGIFSATVNLWLPHML